MKLLARIARTHPWSTVGIVVALTLAGVLEGAGMSAALPLLSHILGGAESSAVGGLEAQVVGALHAWGIPVSTVSLVLLVSGFFALRSVCIFAARRHVGHTVARFITDLRLRLLRAVFAADWMHSIEVSSGGLSNAFALEAQRASQAYLHVVHVAAYAIRFLFLMGIAFLTSWRFAAIALVAALAIGAVIRPLIQRSRRAGARQTTLFLRILRSLADLFQGLKPIKAMGREEQVLPILEKDVRRTERAMRREVTSKEATTAIQEISVLFFLVLGLYAGSAWLGLQINQMVVLGLILQRGASTLNRAQRSYQKMSVDESASDSLFASIERAESRREPRDPGRRVLPEKAIVLHEVGVCVADRWVLDRLSARIPARGVTLICGPSGAGKTTILDLLAGLRIPDRGTLSVDGTPFREVDLNYWRRHIGYVAQDLTLFHDSVFANVALENPDITDADVERALRLAFAWDFVAQLPEGVRSVVGERGGTLSGGERQRIALARALVHRPPILLLDEYTTALDPEAEKAVVETIRSLRGECTIVAISHQRGVQALADHALELDSELDSPLLTDRTHEMARSSSSGSMA